VDFPEDTDVTELSVTDRDGNLIPCYVENLGRTFTYRLPKDRFRKKKFVNRFQVTMLIRAKGVGYNTYLVKPVAAKVDCGLKVGEKGAENKFLSFVIEENGSLTIKDKRSKRVYKNNNIYEDLGDVGESYNFRPVKGDTPITTANDVAKVWVEQQTDFSVTFGIENHIDIPVGAVGKERATETLTHTITTFVTLKADVARIDVNCQFNNQSENHRFRALFQPRLRCQTALAEGQFDVVDREIKPSKHWRNPCYCQRIQAFFGLQDAKTGRGLMVAVRGLNEYEILRDGQNTMALTLLRCVGEMGDWGYFPTPDAQCKGDHSLFYSIIPFAEETRAQAYHQAFTFNGDPLKALQTGKHRGAQPAQKTMLVAEGDYMSFVALKKAEADDDAILRFYNANREETKLTLTFPVGKTSVQSVNLAEEHAKDIDGERVEVTVPAKKIVSYKIGF
jgi:alpha-mannosidase